jgi:hypothetical protein
MFLGVTNDPEMNKVMTMGLTVMAEAPSIGRMANASATFSAGLRGQFNIYAPPRPPHSRAGRLSLPAVVNKRRGGSAGSVCYGLEPCEAPNAPIQPHCEDNVSKTARVSKRWLDGRQ